MLYEIPSADDTHITHVVGHILLHRMICILVLCLLRRMSIICGVSSVYWVQHRTDKHRTKRKQRMMFDDEKTIEGAEGASVNPYSIKREKHTRKERLRRFDIRQHLAGVRYMFFNVEHVS